VDTRGNDFGIQPVFETAFWQDAPQNARNHSTCQPYGAVGKFRYAAVGKFCLKNICQNRSFWSGIWIVCLKKVVKSQINKKMI
jgi:hypothetical protein